MQKVEGGSGRVEEAYDPEGVGAAKSKSKAGTEATDEAIKNYNELKGIGGDHPWVAYGNNRSGNLAQETLSHEDFI